MIVTHETTYKPKVGMTSLTKGEIIRMSEKMIDSLRELRKPLEEQVSHLNNLINYWQLVRLVEKYSTTPVEVVKPKKKRKKRNDKGTHKRPSKEDFELALKQLSPEDMEKVIRKLKNG